MVQLILAAVTMGMLGSFHCIGMCGPIALSLPLKNDSGWSKFSGALFYNSGRIVTYIAFGFLFGIIGKSVSVFGFQQWLSILLGIVILVFIILPKRFSSFNQHNFILRFFERIRFSLGQLFLKNNFSSLFSIGLLNGLLPCGLVYMAAVVAISTSSIAHSMVFMGAFGLGTLPMMWSIAFFGTYVSVGFRKKIRKIYPYMMMLIACLLILRGMGLGIPYVSPKANFEKKEVVDCCARPPKI